MIPSVPSASEHGSAPRTAGGGHGLIERGKTDERRSGALLRALEVKAMRRLSGLVVLMFCLVLFAPSATSAVPQKRPNPNGSVPARWDLPKPPVTRHADTAPKSAGGNGDGTNTLSFASFETGDMVVVGGTLTGHAGEWDSTYSRGSIYDNCIWSANTQPANGVQREAPRKYRAYDYAYGIWVPTASAAARANARSYCRSQLGEPYDISSAKSDQSRWYCSKLCWSSYRYTAGLDLDGDGGFWVWPIDLVNDAQSSLFASAR